MASGYKESAVMATVLEQLIGHERQKQIWQKAREQKSLAHAFLFVGPPGVGKKTTALAFAQTLICPEGGCGRCSVCQRVQHHQSESVLFVEADEQKKISVEAARGILKFFTLRSLTPARVVIIDAAEALNPQAANALLKLIEEPPEGSYFFLISASETSVLPTIRSRCQVLRFSTLNANEMQRLTQIEAEDWRLNASRGRLDLFEQLTDPELKNLRAHALELLTSLLTGRELPETAFETFKKKVEAGVMIRFFQQLLRDLRVYPLSPELIINRDLEDALQTLSQIDSRRLDQAFELVLQLERDWWANVDRGMMLGAFRVELSRSTAKS